MKPLTILLACSVIVLLAGVALAQDKDGPKGPKVTEVKPAQSGLTGQIRVRVEGLPPAADRAAQLKEYSGWVLFLDGQAMPGVVATSIDLQNGDFYFELVRDKDSKESARAWKRAFGGKLLGRTLSVSLGPAAGGAHVVALPAAKFRLVLFAGWGAVGGVGAYVVVIGLFILAGWRTKMLRGTEVKGSGVKPPYSLARAQFAWWSVIVIGAYLFLGLGTANWTAAFSSTALTLIGIATATGGAAVGVDAFKRPNPPKLEAKIAGLDERANLLKQTVGKAPAAETPALAAQLQDSVEQREQAKVELADARTALGAPVGSDNFWQDLASDREGVVVHRLQALVWNVILGVVFIVMTVRDLAMPDFDNTLLALLGVSSGAYVGFKMPEKG